MRKVFFIVIALCLSVIHSYAGVSNTLDKPDVISSAEYEVYSALFKHYLSTQVNLSVFWRQPRVLIVRQETDTRKKLDGKSVKFFEESIGSSLFLLFRFDVKLDATLIEDFNRKNERAYILENRLSIPLSVILISERELDQIFDFDEGWKEFYKRYPGSGGYITVSRVGFNKDKSEAFVYISSQSGWLIGSGYFVLLSRPSKDDKWGVVKEVMLWIS